MHILYLASILPKRSETFVYREVLGLRERGVKVSVASVHAPESSLGDARLDALSQEAEVVYGRGLVGKAAVLRDSIRRMKFMLPWGVGDVPLNYIGKYLWQWEAADALAFRLRGQGVTHIHAHMAHVPTTIAMGCAKALGIPFSFTGHAADLFRDHSALKTKLARSAFTACISHWHRGFYRELIPSLSEDELPIIRCGVDLEAFSVVDPDAATPGHILGVGRLVPKKGFDVLIRAMAKLDAGRVTLVGDGPEESNLKRLADELGVADRIDFVGAKTNDQVRELMVDAMVCVLPCKPADDGDRDGIPVVLMEAMARGVAVISGDLPTIRELIADGESGLMVPPGNSEALAEAIGDLLSQSETRQRLAAAGRTRVEEEFSLSVTLDRLIAAFRRAAEVYDKNPAVVRSHRHD
jgi:glycosyltransferase involved in cell wall biosynthesis